LMIREPTAAGRPAVSREKCPVPTCMCSPNEFDRCGGIDDALVLVPGTPSLNGRAELMQKHLRSDGIPHVKPRRASAC
jgi:hypothetical protein